MKKEKILFLIFTSIIVFTLQFIFLLFIIKINNLNKILAIKDTLHKIILLSVNFEREIKGYKIDNNFYIFSLPSIDINKTFIQNNKDLIIINHNNSIVLFKLYPSELSIRKNKTIQFFNVKSIKIIDSGLINFFCNINNEIVESDFYMDKEKTLLPDDYKVF